MKTPRLPLRIGRALVFGLVLLTATTPLAGATPTPAADDLELPAMTLTPADLERAGLDHYRLNFGGLRTLDAAAARLAENGNVTEREARAGLEDAGFQWWYENAMHLWPEGGDAMGEYRTAVRSYVVQFADDQGAARAWDLFQDESGDHTAQDLRQVAPYGDQSEATRYHEGDVEAIDLTFRLGNLHAGVLLFDSTGNPPSLDDTEALASILLDRVETVIAHGGPGLSGRILRLAGDEVVASVDNYLIAGGEAIHFYSETALDRRQRQSDAAKSGQTDHYTVWQQLATLGPGQEDDVWFFANVRRFGDENAARDWLAGTEDRIAMNARLGQFAIDPTAATFGDESVTYTVAQTERPISYRIIVLRIAGTVAEISLQGPGTPDPDAIARLATLQTDCLAEGGCFAPAPVPGAVQTYIATLAASTGDQGNQ